MKGRLSILFLLLLLAGMQPAFASHIAGGQITYVYDGNNTYTINVVIYEDCLEGDPTAIAQDDPVFLSIFDGNGVPQHALIPPGHQLDSIGITQKGDDPYAIGEPFYEAYFDPTNKADNFLVPTNFSNSCINNAPPTCLRKKTFSLTVILPPNGTGYKVVYQRCCRNAAIINLLDPSNIGITYYATIPPSSVAVGNNSAVFKNDPPQIICESNPLVYDNSATDADGDSLSYGFTDTYEGGSNSNAKPIPPPPPYNEVTYRPPYSYATPMCGFPQMQIDPVSGLLTGTPNCTGRFVVTVACYEWRNQVCIDTVKREFEFVVTNCSKAVVANIPQLSSFFNTYIVDCNGYTVPFENTSVGGFAYHWNFGTGNPADTSNLFQPTFTYADTGTYLVSLVVNPGSTCSDSISRFVKVFPFFHTSFDDTGRFCPDSTIAFKDLSASSLSPASTWQWNFGDGTLDTTQNPVHNYAAGGLYNVVLMSGNSYECTDTLLKQVLVEKFRPFAGDDTIIVKGESIDFDATGGNEYVWTPSDELSNPDINDPVGYYPDTGHFSYVVNIASPFGCVGNDTINVQVVGQADLFVPSGFTPNDDGLNDELRPIAIGYRSLNYFRVFNRWGQMVFNSTFLEEGWNGTFGGKPAPMDTYYWELSLVNRNGTEEKAKGSVTLVR